MRTEQFKTVTDRELAEQYLAMAEEDKASVEKEIIDRFVADKAKPRTAKAAAKNMIPVIIGLYFGGLLGRLLSEYTGNIGDIVHFYGIWQDNIFNINYYCNEEDEASEKDA